MVIVMKKKPGMTATEHDASPPKNKLPLPPPARFPTVGIGASAGGLEALERFLQNMAENCGGTFVVVQHLERVCARR